MIKPTAPHIHSQIFLAEMSQDLEDFLQLYNLQILKYLGSVIECPLFFFRTPSLGDLSVTDDFQTYISSLEFATKLVNH